MTQFQAEKYMS